jgi:D-glycero-D-manno-heptose 1,7-bisphosphate phosphatase
MSMPVNERLRPAVFLDRDGVINQMVYNPEFGLVDSPSNPDQLILYSGIPEAIARINQMGYLAVVATNQPGIAKGKFSEELLDAITQKMISEVADGGGVLDGIYSCLHHPDAIAPGLRIECVCRKPKPGLLLQAAKDLNIDLSKSYMVGDGITDVQAGRAAGVQTFLVGSRKCYVCDQLAKENARPDYLVRDLVQAVQTIDDLRLGKEAGVEEFHFRCTI